MYSPNVHENLIKEISGETEPSVVGHAIEWTDPQGSHSLVFMTWYNSLPLGVGKTYDLLLTNKIWQRTKG
jgi:hypothetical protein